MRFYIAAPLSESFAADLAAQALRERGHIVTSTWHSSSPGPKSDPVLVKKKRAIWKQCKKELRQADHLVVYTASGQPRATFVELGYFLGLAAESHSMGGVYWISPDAETCPVPVGDPLVTHCKSVAEFLEAVK